MNQPLDKEKLYYLQISIEKIQNSSDPQVVTFLESLIRNDGFSLAKLFSDNDYDIHCSTNVFVWCMHQPEIDKILVEKNWLIPALHRAMCEGLTDVISICVAFPFYRTSLQQLIDNKKWAPPKMNYCSISLEDFIIAALMSNNILVLENLREYSDEMDSIIHKINMELQE